MPVDTITGPNGVLLAVVPEDTKVDIRRYCGYPAYGFGTTAFFALGFWLQNYGNMELRLNALTVSEYTRITSYYLPNIAALEDDLFAMREAMIVDTAAVFKRNMNEAGDRHGEYSWWLDHLVNFLGIKPGPHFEGGSSVNARFIK